MSDRVGRVVAVLSFLPLVLVVASTAALAADVLPPAEVEGLLLGKSAGDVSLTWDAVTANVVGGPETVAAYRVYRGTSPGFVPDEAGGSNRIVEVSGTSFTDPGALGAPTSYFYLVTAVDAAGNESNAQRSAVTTPPTLSTTFTSTAAQLSWSGAAPPASVSGYLVYWGTTSSGYDQVRDVGPATSTGIFPLTPGLTYYFAVVAYDAERNLSAPSNETSGQIGGGGGSTEVCGRIATSTTWTPAGSPYVVTCDVTVYGDTGPFLAPSPAILTIEPGVLVKFNAGTGLTIGSGANQGGLVANGTASNPIVFTGNQTFPTAGFWDGLSFTDATVDAQTSLQWVVVEYGGLASGAAVTLASTSFPIRDATITDGLNHGIALTGGSAPVIERVTIEDMPGNALRATSSSPVLRDSTLRRIGGYGLFFSLTTSPVIEDSILDHGLFFDTATGDATIQGNTLQRYEGFPARVGADDAGELSQNTFQGTGPTSRIEVMADTIATDATWANTGMPYHVLGIVTVARDAAAASTLTIAPGTTLKFAASTRLQISSLSARGALVAAGTPSEPITFTTASAVPAPGQWQAILFDSASEDATSRLEHCVVEYGGATQLGQVRIDSAGPLVKNCTIRNSSSAGVYATLGNSSTIEACSFSGNAGFDVHINGTSSTWLKGSTLASSAFFDTAGGGHRVTGNVFGGYNNAARSLRVGAHAVAELATNTFNGTGAASEIEVLGETLATDASWPNLAFPYEILGTVTVARDATAAATLTLAPGSTLRFAPGTRLAVATTTALGALIAAGTPEQPITFTSNSATPTPGSWQSVYFESATVDATSRLEHCVVEYAGATFTGAVRMDASGPTIRNCSIRNSSTNGIVATAGNGSTIEACTFSGNGTFDVNIAGTSSTWLKDSTLSSSAFFDTAGGGHRVTGNTFQGYNNAARSLRIGAHAVAELGTNTFNGIGPNSEVEVLGEALAADASWPALGFPLEILQTVTVARDPVTAATLTLAPGTTLRFAPATRLQIASGTSKGALVAVGTPLQPITFTSNAAVPAPGQWQAVQFEDGTVDATSILEHCVAEYGGATQSGVIRVEASSPTIRSCTIRNSSTNGVIVTTSGAPTLESCTFSGNASFDVNVTGASATWLKTSTLTSSAFFDTATGGHRVTGNTFNAYDNPARSLRVGAHAVAELGTNTFNGTGASSEVEVLGETLAADATWPHLGFPYEVLGVITVAGDTVTPVTLTLSPGNTLRFAASTRLQIASGTSKGALVAVGTAAQPITFTSNAASPAPGGWQAVYFDDGTVDATSVLEHCVVEYGGTTYSGNVRLVSASPAIRNCTIRNGSANGINVSGGNSSTIEACTFSGNASFDVNVTGASATWLKTSTLTSSAFFDTATGGHRVTGSTFNAYDNAARSLRVGAHAVAELGTNTFNGTGASSEVEVLGETLAADATWPNLGFPYEVLGVVTVARDTTAPATLTLTAGTTLRFAAATRLQVGNGATRGALVAVGTPAEPITFRSNATTPAPGQWQGIQFDDGTEDATSRLEHCVVEHGGATNSANVRLNGASPTIRSCTIRNSSVYGINGTTVISTASSPRVESCTFTGNTNYDAFFDAGSAILDGNAFSRAARFDGTGGKPTVTDNTFDGYVAPFLLRVGADAITGLTGNAFNGTDGTSKIEVLGETLSGQEHWARLPVPYAILVSNLTVNGTFTDPARLTLDPGVTLRFGSGLQLVVATNTSQAELIAVGTAVDKILFTTDAASPAAGQWRGLLFDNGTAFDAVLEHVIVEYAGGSGSAAVQITRANLPFRHSTVRFSGSYGIQADDAAPILDDVTVTSTGNSGMRFVSASNDRAPSVTDCTVTAPTGYGIINSGVLSTAISATTVDNGVFFDSASGRPSVQNTVLNNYDTFPLRIGADAIAGLLNLTFNGTGPSSRIEVIGETLSEDALWSDLGLPYQVVSGTLAVAKTSAVRATLTIQAGVTLKFAAGTLLQVGTSSLLGALVAVGTAADPIVFTTANAAPAPGQWRGIHFLSGTVDDATVLDRVVVEYAGATDNANLLFSSAHPRILRSTIRNGSQHGLSLTSSSPTVDGCTIESNGAWGVNLASTSLPRLLHNTFSGNTSGAINQTTASRVDARLNWYGDASGPAGSGPGTGQGVSANVEFDPWLRALPSTANRIEDLFVTTRTFAPGSYTRVAGGVMSVESDWTFEVLDTGNTVVRTMTGTGTEFVLHFDGTDDAAVPLVDGPYTFRFSAVGKVIPDVTAQATGRLTLDATFARGEIDTPAYLQTHGQGDLVPIVGSASGSGFTNYTLQYGAGLFPAAFTNIVNASTSQVNGGTLGTWNTAGLANGVYSLRLLVNNNLAEQTVVNLGTFVLAINTLGVDRAFFSPNDDTRSDDVTASATLSTSASWTLRVRRVATTEIVRTWSGAGTSVRQTWNGREADDTTVAGEGDYRFELEAVKDGETVASTSAVTNLDVTAPAASIADPTSGEQVFATVPILGDAYDPNNHFQDYLLERGIGAAPLSFVAIAPAQTVPVTGGFLANWVTNDAEATEPIANGPYQIRLTVNDRAGNLTRATRQVAVDNLVLGQVAPSQTVFDTSADPDVDIQFSINRPANVTLKIYPEAPGEAGALVKTATASFAPGPNAFSWDGTDGTGTTVADEAYVYVLEASDGSGRTDRFSPAGGRGVGSGTGNPDPSYNTFLNDWWTMDYTNQTGGRVTMQVTPAAEPVFNVFTEAPSEVGTFTIRWDGRRPDGSIVPGASSVYFPAPITLRPNYIITKGDTPRTTGLASAPYRIFQSFAHVSRLSFHLERPANVTVTILPPGVADPSSPQGRRLVDNQSMTAGDYTITFDPTDPLDPTGDSMSFSQEGPFTFAVQAVNPETGRTHISRGIVTMYK